MVTRTTDTAVNPMFLERWSPRAFDGSDMPKSDLDTIFEAARFAPSAMNLQPWRFLYARRGDENWERFLSWLVPKNREWAQNASVICYIVSKQVMGEPERPNRSHSFDAGAAWVSLALQATLLGYHTHAMAGVDFVAAAAGLDVPESFRVEAAVVIGKMGNLTQLSEELRAREVISPRKPRDEIACPGNFRA